MSKHEIDHDEIKVGDVLTFERDGLSVTGTVRFFELNGSDNRFSNWVGLDHIGTTPQTYQADVYLYGINTLGYKVYSDRPRNALELFQTLPTGTKFVINGDKVERIKLNDRQYWYAGTFEDKDAGNLSAFFVSEFEVIPNE